MAIYRESTPIWRRRLPLILAVGIGVVIVVIALSAADRSQPAVNSPQATADAALEKLSQSLDLFDIEYVKVAKGTPAAQTGAPGAIRTALDALSAAPSLKTLDAASFMALQTDLNTMNAYLSTSPAPDISATMSDAQTALQALNRAQAAFTASSPQP